jgi:hypothetical protein
MDHERKRIKAALERELESVRLPRNVSDRVMRAAERKLPVWEKELTLPLPVLVCVLALFIGSFVVMADSPAEPVPAPSSYATKTIILDSGVFAEASLPPNH